MTARRGLRVRARWLASWAVATAIVAAPVLLVAASPGGGAGKLAPDLRERLSRGAPGETARVILRMKDLVTPADHEKVRGLGGNLRKSLKLVNSLAAELPVSRLEELAGDPRVAWISPDRKVRPSMQIAAAAAGATPPQIEGGLTGSGVTIAVVDSGIDPHPALPALKGVIDFVQPNAPVTRDQFGHGTHVAGIIAGKPVVDPAGDRLLFSGIAPGAELISLRVLDRKGEGYTSDVIQAIEWAIQNRDPLGIRVLNLSLGHFVGEPAPMDPLVAACEKAWRLGLVVVTSAGNLGELGNGSITSPGNAPLILTAGALDDSDTAGTADDELAPYSSRGPSFFDLILKPDLLAPGHGIVSLRAAHSSLDVSHPEARVSLEGGSRGSANKAQYFEMSGSSMSAAVVSGVVALMLEADPALNPDTVKARLMASARRDSFNPVYARGAGEMDAAAALDHPGRARSAISPAVYRQEDEVLIREISSSWGAGEWSLEAIYGDAIHWQTEFILYNGFLDDPCVTGEGLIWQGRTVDGEGLIWQGRTVDSEGLIWQGRSVDDEGLIWQGKADKKEKVESANPGGNPSELACTSAAGLIWQGRTVDGEGLIWQGVTGEGLIWQGRTGL